MSKLLSVLIAAVFAAVTFTAVAADEACTSWCRCCSYSRTCKGEAKKDA